MAFLSILPYLLPRLGAHSSSEGVCGLWLYYFRLFLFYLSHHSVMPYHTPVNLIPEFQVTLVPMGDFLDPHSLLSICWSLQASPVHGLPSQPFEYWFLTSPCSSLHLTVLVSVWLLQPCSAPQLFRALPFVCSPTYLWSIHVLDSVFLCALNIKFNDISCFQKTLIWTEIGTNNFEAVYW